RWLALGGDRQAGHDVLHEPGVHADEVHGGVGGDGVVLAAVVAHHADADRGDGLAVLEELGVVEHAHGGAPGGSWSVCPPIIGGRAARRAGGACTARHGHDAAADTS